MNNNKQTAVEWIMSQLPEILGEHILSNLDVEQTNRIHFLEKQAKEMEKEQQDTFAIEFAEWYENDVLAKGDYEMITKDKKELLEIFKETYEQQ